MFKCCVCNSASKKVDGKGRSSDSSGTPAAVESPKLTGTLVEVDDATRTSSVRIDKSNGDVPRTEESSSTEASSSEAVTLVRADSTTKSLDEERRDGSGEDFVDEKSDSNSTKLEDEVAKVIEVAEVVEAEAREIETTEMIETTTEATDDSIIVDNEDDDYVDKPARDGDDSRMNEPVEDGADSHVDKPIEDRGDSHVDTIVEDGADSYVDTLVEDGADSHVDKPVEDGGDSHVDTLVEDRSDSYVDTVVEDRADSHVDKFVEDRGDIHIDTLVEDGGGSHTGEPVENGGDNHVDEDLVEADAGIVVAEFSPTRMNLYNASGYIERTIDDGPEDEGDDSVFEACPIENDSAVKKTTPVAPLPRWLSEEDDGEHVAGGCSGVQEPPATPVARDELALRRHRFFSELLQAAHNSSEHRVRFDPLGPKVHTGCSEINDREEYLEQLVNRLENVTSRLEQVPILAAVQTQNTAVQTNTPSPKKRTLSESESPTENSPALLTFCSKQQIIPNQPVSMSVAGYEDLLTGPVKEYLQLSQKIGGDVATHSKLVEKAFQIQLQFIQTAASRSAPTNQSEQLALLGPMSAQIQQIQDFREKNRGSSFFNHLSAISESIPALGWVAVSPTPAPYVKEMNDAGQFYTNRVLKDWKEKDKIHINWCKAWVQTLTDLQQYVRQHHTTGLVWAKTGAAPGGIPPPPPPSMPIGDIAPLAINDDRSALFAQINQGEDITKNLKKVTSDMQTHKNPSLRSGPAPFKAPVVSNVAPMKNVLPANAPIDKPSVFTRDGKKWLIEYHKGESLVIDNAEMNNVVYMFRCQDSTLTIKGKINSIVMDSCRKSSVVFDSLVSSIEFVNCQSVQMQVLGKVPTISIDKTDGCQMYLSTGSLDVEFITSKSSEMNVMVPKANGDYTEYPIPEQFKTTISRNGLNTIAVDSLG